MGEFAGEVDLGLDVAAVPARFRREWGRVGAEEALEDGHEEEHGDENGGGDEAEGDSVDGTVEVCPMLVSVNVQWSSYWRPHVGVGVIFDHHF